MNRGLKQKVLYCLEKYPMTRNSDIQLTVAIWLEYHRQYVFQDERGEWCIKVKNLDKLPTQDDVKRWRAKIQNDPKHPKFVPTDSFIARMRGWKEEEWRRALSYNPEMRRAYQVNY